MSSVTTTLPAVLLSLLLCGLLGACSSATPPAPLPVLKLMPLGDSITLGVNTPAGYRTTLWQQLVQTDGQSIDFVGSQRDGADDLGDQDHEGHSGWRIDEVRDQVDGWLSTAQPDIVLLHIGTNDIFQYYELSTAPERLADLVNRICTDRPDVQLAVASLVPTPGEEAEVDAFNAQVPGIVDAAHAGGCAVRFVDMFSAVHATDILGGHPTQQGYDKMAAAWYPAVQAMVEARRTSSGG